LIVSSSHPKANGHLSSTALYDIFAKEIRKDFTDEHGNSS
jgi:hypothetical protein